MSTPPKYPVPKDHRLIQDLYKVVINDSWVFGVIWGEQRCGKSSLALWISYFLWRMLDLNLDEDQLWYRAINSNLYSLTQLIYKIKSPSTPRVWETNHRHYRDPYENWDDFGANSNKAETQHSRAWDKFKGGFDVLGTKLAILMCTMTTPDQPTSQLLQKYNLEIHIPERGKYKYDRVIWQQDFHGWSAKKLKGWEQNLCSFDEIPEKWYVLYDEQRMTLADEVIIGIEDELTREIPWILKRTKEPELQLLQIIVNEGALAWDVCKNRLGGNKGALISIKRAKSHQLIVGDSRNGRTFYDITNLGLEVLNQHNLQGEEE